jgi:hypothetical protein
MLMRQSINPAIVTMKGFYKGSSGLSHEPNAKRYETNIKTFLPPLRDRHGLTSAKVWGTSTCRIRQDLDLKIVT